MTSKFFGKTPVPPIIYDSTGSPITIVTGQSDIFINSMLETDCKLNSCKLLEAKVG